MNQQSYLILTNNNKLVQNKNSKIHNKKNIYNQFFNFNNFLMNKKSN